MINPEIYCLELSEKFSTLERKVSNLQREISQMNEKIERNKFIIISIIGYLKNHQSLDMEEFDAIVDFVDKLDGEMLNGKTNASLDYGNFRKEMNEALAKMDPRIAKMKFSGKLSVARQQELSQKHPENVSKPARLNIPKAD